MDQNDIKRLDKIDYGITSPQVMKQTKKHDFTYKIILIGSSGVGKSCMKRKIMDYDGTAFFQHAHQATLGVEHGTCGIKIHDKSIKLEIYDTAGQERFKAVARMFYQQADMVFLTYDMTDERSFDELSKFYDEVQYSAADARVYLISNKADLTNQMKVSKK